MQTASFGAVCIFFIMFALCVLGMFAELLCKLHTRGVAISFLITLG